MDAGTFINNSSTAEHDPSLQHGEGTAAGFHWQVHDTALLLPNHLGISRVQRAWDRKPQTAYSRPGSRVGKVWKRPQTASRPAAMAGQDAVADSRVTKRRKARRSSPGGERKPLKKMCLDSGFGLAPRVLAWDGAESPTRKIVTRTSAANEELIALPDEEASEDNEEGADDVTVEILDEDGTVLDVNPAEAAQDADWEDEEQDEPVEEDEFNDTMMHLADIINASQQHEPVGVSHLGSGDPAAIESLDDLPEIEQENQDPSLTQLPEALPQLQPVAPVLPEGFVSPMKTAVPVVKNRRRSIGPRRRTLPRQFAPSPLSQVMNMEDSFHELSVENDALSSPTIHGHGMDSRIAHAVAEAPNVDAQWEDVDEVSPPPATVPTQDEHFDMIEQASSGGLLRDSIDVPIEEILAAEASFANDEVVYASPSAISPQHMEHLDISGKLPSSPIPTIEGQHPRLPLRRSPRRKSTSPRKKSTILPSTEKPHLVAFTPVKAFQQTVFTSSQQAEDTEIPDSEDTSNVPSSPFERSASAPPEEPQMSPRKPVKPRVSDDTALLQAFLNRAAENKGTRRMSAAKRESISNRRDSDSVRQALGQSVSSPAKADVLGELDVNSPSPRKPSTSAMDTSAAFDEVINEAAKAAQDDAGDDSSVGQRTRRSGRGSKKAQPSTPAAPNKIAIKGSADSIVLKRTEAQEMALLTRTNTRKNKGGAVLPPLRLTKMGSQLNTSDADASVDGQDGAAVGKPDGARGVKWAETLVEYFLGGELSEASIMSDELNAPTTQTTEKMDTDNEAAAGIAQTVPPASETPSKPKIRRLKASRTAATPGKPPVAAEVPAEPEKLAAPESKATAPTKRRSRIATPAKGLTNGSLLPSELDPQPVVPAPAAEIRKAAPAKKKAPLVSKLPGPASSTTSSLGQGKENLISSPAKKKPTFATTAATKNVLPTAKTFAPKLDFSKSTKLEPATMSDGQGDVVPGLMSPAKKAGRSRNVFASAKESESDGVDGRAEMPGLSSPAKKRTRRAV